ncbi:hypothetical protein SDC9_186581 [bioreactor metagenome]|uniref:Uncharacterized protein n=1 Tax=bioreactor metagenome TaxID=1076179 RepID=A0A645HJ61_9ZZZZ
MRVTGVSFRSLYADFGFSPSASFMAQGAKRTIWSTHRPLVLMAADWPAMGLELPGPVTTAVTPPARASSKQRSRGLMASMARRLGVQGSVDSLPSSPSKPKAFPNMPRWQWASMRPGRIWPPFTSRSSPSGEEGSRSMGPTWAMRPSSTATKPRGITGPSMGWTTPFNRYIFVKPPFDKRFG